MRSERVFRSCNSSKPPTIAERQVERVDGQIKKHSRKLPLEVAPTTLETFFRPVTANFDVWPWPSRYQQMYRSEIISFKSYCPNMRQTHTHTGPIVLRGPLKWSKSNTTPHRNHLRPMVLSYVVACILQILSTGRTAITTALILAESVALWVITVQVRNNQEQIFGTVYIACVMAIARAITCTLSHYDRRPRKAQENVITVLLISFRRHELRIILILIIDVARTYIDLYWRVSCPCL